MNQVNTIMSELLRILLKYEFENLKNEHKENYFERKIRDKSTPLNFSFYYDLIKLSSYDTISLLHQLWHLLLHIPTAMVLVKDVFRFEECRSPYQSFFSESSLITY